MERDCLVVDIECNNDVFPFLPEQVAQESVLIARSDPSSYLKHYGLQSHEGLEKRGRTNKSWMLKSALVHVAGHLEKDEQGSSVRS